MNNKTKEGGKLHIPLKVEELRIGNYFYLTLDGEENELCICNKYDFEDDPETWLRKQPIELTEEWLVKFGFELINDIIIHRRKDYSIDGMDIEVIENEFFHYVNGQKIILKYVHDLQNTYYWNSGKKELEIKP